MSDDPVVLDESFNQNSVQGKRPDAVISDRILEAGFRHASIRHWASYVFVIALLYVLVTTTRFFTNYISSLDLLTSSDSVKNTVITVITLKSAGLIGFLCTFFFRGFPKA